MKRKILTILLTSLLALALLVVPLTACEEKPEETQSNPITQLQSQVNNLNTQYSSLSTKVTALETAVNSINVPAGLSGQVSNLVDDLVILQDDVADLQAEVENYSAFVEEIDAINTALADVTLSTEDFGRRVTELEDLSATLATQDSLDALVDAVATDIALLQEEIDNLNTNGAEYDDSDLWDAVEELEEDLAALTIALDELTDDLNVVNVTLIAALSNLQSRVATLEFIALGQVVISEFHPSYLKFTTRIAGAYVVVLTLYGTGLNLVGITGIPIDVNTPFDQCYGTSNTMRVVVFQPLAGSPPTIPTTWTANRTVTIGFTGTGVSYATIGAGVR